MTTKVLILRTFTDALSLFTKNIPMYLKGIALPVVLFVATYIPMFMHPMAVESVTVPMPAYVGLLSLIQGLLVLWIINISYRLALTGQPGKIWWSMNETWTVIYLILLGIIVFIGSGIPAMIGFVLISMVDKMAAMVVAGLIYILGGYYITARLISLFPSIAIGEKVHLGDIWQLSKGNGVRIMITLLLTSLFIAIVFGICAMFMGGQAVMGSITMLIISLINIVLLSFYGTVIALIYKELKQGIV